MSRDQSPRSDNVSIRPIGERPIFKYGVVVQLVMLAIAGIVWVADSFDDTSRLEQSSKAHVAEQVEKPKTPYVDVCFKALEGEELIEVHADWWIVGASTEVYIKLTPDDERAGWHCGELELVRGVAQSYQFLKMHGGPFQDMEVCHMHQSDFEARVCDTLRCSDTMCVYVPIVLTQRGEWLNVSVLADYPTPESIYNMPMFR